ncbi:MAG: thioesterase family protein [Alphaproteobacteria bacterium]
MDNEEALLHLYTDVVRPEWIDYNGHMNVAYYVLAFDHATDAFFDHIGLDHAYKAANNSTTFIVDMNVSYLCEVLEGDPLRFVTRILDYDEKRLHFFHEMFHAEKGYLAATNEIMAVHISLGNRRMAPMGVGLQHRIAEIGNRHRQLELPEKAGRKIGIRRKKLI